MNTSIRIQEKFSQMGARVDVRLDQRTPFRVDVRRDAAGERFELRHPPGVDVRVLDARPTDRHLLLAARNFMTSQELTFLCGHDERSWFVAAIPESARAETVQEAKDALKPPEVWDSIHETQLPFDQRDTRRNAAFLRQGEWFFLPRPWMEVDDSDVLRDEPIRRGFAKPHLCEFLYRMGGETVYVSHEYPNGITLQQRRRLARRERRRQRWVLMTRDARVFVRGAIRHDDHDTITLGYWHLVVMNTETQAKSMRNVAFLD